MVVEAVPERQLRVGEDGPALHAHAAVPRVEGGGVPLGRGLDVPLTVAAVIKARRVGLVLEDVEALVPCSAVIVVGPGEDYISRRQTYYLLISIYLSIVILNLRVMHGHEGQSEGVGPLPVAPVLRGQVGVPVLAVVVDVHIVVVAGCWVWWVLVI